LWAKQWKTVFSCFGLRRSAFHSTPPMSSLILRMSSQKCLTSKVVGMYTGKRRFTLNRSPSGKFAFLRTSSASSSKKPSTIWFAG
jgi:hypothetical protein